MQLHAIDMDMYMYMYNVCDDLQLYSSVNIADQ